VRQSTFTVLRLDESLCQTNFSSCLMLISKTDVVLNCNVNMLGRTKVARLIAQSKKQAQRAQSQADEIVRLRSCLAAQASIH
jgi:hypothetical protein